MRDPARNNAEYNAVFRADSRALSRSRWWRPRLVTITSWRPSLPYAISLLPIPLAVAAPTVSLWRLLIAMLTAMPLLMQSANVNRRSARRCGPRVRGVVAVLPY